MLNRLLDRFRQQVPFHRVKQDLLGRRQEIPIFGLTGSSPALLLAMIGAEVRPLVVVAEHNRAAEQLAADLRFFSRCQDLNPAVVILPASETDPYRGISPHPEIAEQRSLALWKILQNHVDVIVATERSVLQKMISPERLRLGAWVVEVGQEISIDRLLQHFRLLGYVREDPVTDIGEFAHRGGIVDVFSPSGERPVRVEFFGDRIESLREYDPASQRSMQFVNSLAVVPMREFWLTPEEWNVWAEQAALFWKDSRFADMLQQRWTAAQEGEDFNGFEFIAPLSLPVHSRLSDFAPKAVWAVFEPEQIKQRWNQEWVRLHELEREAVVAGELALPPERLYWSQEEFQQEIGNRRRLVFQELRIEDSDLKGTWAVDFSTTPAEHFNGRIRDLVDRAEQACKERQAWLLVMHSQGMADRLADIFNEYGLLAACLKPGETIDSQRGAEAETHPHGLFVTVGLLSRGFELQDARLHVFSQSEIFGEPELQAQPRARREKTGVFISDFRDLKNGDYVVHIDHGIGEFQGLRKIGVGDGEKEFVLLQYRDQAKLYVPAERLDLIQKYTSLGETRPPLDRLGGASWEKTKTRIKKSMRDMAEELLRLYARRKMARGHAFRPDDALQSEFEQAFEFTETADQAAAIVEVKRDMEAETPMDRLVCGDVGYGKTEVAMRAAFKAVMDGKQVAVLAPTTILAFQHFNTFCSRFQAFPVRVEMISRLRSSRQQKQTRKDVEAGRVDILIGTHRLLSRDIKFLDLGLVVVDEEQRFGVAQKEWLKKMKTQVDVLTLSATPIPRTLNMSMIGLRDLSIIETPPKDRLAIQTVVSRFSHHLIRSAIEHELARQGQVFFVHNRVESIHSIARMIQQICPAARVAVGHGQMAERQLEDVMLKFVHYEFDVLVATTIIENGLDIPRANTLVVDRADRCGLAQLYQLRGRVGRSNRRAYAYLVVPSDHALSPVASKRLATIKEFSDLGAGFKIAAMDMEIRGAGNLLGGEQHGHISAIGFELYLQLLERSIRELKGEEIDEEHKTSIDLKLDIRIPDHYIDDANQRLRVYKRISQARDEQELEEIRLEITDQYGRYPKTLLNLFEYARLRLAAQRLKVVSIDRKAGEVLIKFSENAPVAPERLTELVASRPGTSFSPAGLLRLPLDSERPADLFVEIHGVLCKFLSPPGPHYAGQDAKEIC